MEESIRRQMTEYNRIFKEEDGLYREVSRRLDLPETELWILYLLRLEGGCTQRELRERMLQARQSVNTALKAMEQRGEISMTPAEGDRRSRTIRLTERGEGLSAEAAEPVLAAEAEAMASLTAAERETLLRLWAKYVAELAKGLGSGKGGAQA